MIGSRTIVFAGLMSFAMQAIAYRHPTAKCGWTGCLYEPGPIVEQQRDSIRVAAPDSSAIVATIQKMTAKSQALQAPAASLTIVNGPLIIAGLGPFPEIIRGFTDIVATATEGLAANEDMSPVKRAEQADVLFDTFRDFVRVHQALLTILIGRSGLFVTVPFVGAPVAAVLRQIEAVVDNLAFLLVDTAQSRATDIQSLAASLGTTIDTAIASYSGV